MPSVRPLRASLLAAGAFVEATITPPGANTFEFKVEGEGADLTGTVNPVAVELLIGDDDGSTTVEAEFEMLP